MAKALHNHQVMVIHKISNKHRWLLGMIALFLPAVMAAIGMYLDHTNLKHDDLYTALIPVAGWSSMILAATVPTALILTTPLSWSRRLSYTAVVGCLLLLELYLIFITVMSSH